MERVEGDCALLDHGAGVRAVCADDAEATLKTGNIIGGIGAAFFVVSLFTSLRVSNVFALLGIALMLIAAWFGSRKWLFAVGGVLVLIGIMYLILLHKD
jgi:hypothetical protein